MDEEQYNYASYLLRLWKAQQDGQTIWRASLECAQDGQRFNFADLEALILFLKDQFGARLGDARSAGDSKQEVLK